MQRPSRSCSGEAIGTIRLSTPAAHARILENLLQDPGARSAPTLELVSVEDVSYHHEAVAKKDLRRPVDLVRFGHFKAVNSVMRAQMFAQLAHLGIVVSPAFRSPWYPPR